MVDRDELKENIWNVIKKEAVRHCAFVINEKDLHHETEALEVFPTHLSETQPYFDEHANRYGLMIASAWLKITEEYNIYIKVDFEVRKEFQLFPTLGDVYRYIYSRVGPEVLGGNDDDGETIY